MRKIVGLITFVMLPIAIVITAFQCALAFVEDSIR
jgi:hypothetical protein